MAIFRSAFWLGVAFVAIGPNTDWGQNTRSAAQSALGATAAIAQDQVVAADCSDVLCHTQKVMVTHSIETLHGQAAALIGANDNIGAGVSVPATLAIAPNPAPRITR